MTIKEYTESCLKFAEASKGWEKPDELEDKKAEEEEKNV